MIKVVPPTALAYSDVTTSVGHLPTGSEPTFVYGTTYALGDKVKFTEGGGHQTTRIYESLQNSNVNQYPSPDHAGGPTAWWAEVSPPIWDAAVAYFYSSSQPTLHRVIHNNKLWRTNEQTAAGDEPGVSSRWTYLSAWNPWAMFQYDTNESTTDSTSPVTVTITPGVKTNSVACFGCDCETIRIQASSTAGGGSIYDETIDMEDTLSGNWYNAVYGANRNKTVAAVFDVPAYADTVYTLTFTNTAGDVVVGAAMVGTFVSLGDAPSGSVVSELANYSEIARDATTGLATLTTQAPVPLVRGSAKLDLAEAQHAFRARRDLNGVPAAWFFFDDSADEYFEMTSVAGIYRRFPLQLGKAVVDIGLDVESL